MDYAPDQYSTLSTATSLSDDEISGEDFNDDTHITESPTFIVTDLLTSLGEKTQEPDYLVTKGNDLVLLLQQYPYIKNDLVFSAFGHRLQTLLTHPKKEVVATGYRICRYVINDVSSIRSLILFRVDIMIVISLSKGYSYGIEREQALKLIRKFIDMPNGHLELTKGIANAVMSIAEQVDDKLRSICVQTACEISLVRPDLIKPSSLLQFIIDGPFELSSIVATTFMTIMNQDGGHKYIQKGDILRLISPFTEFPIKGHINTEKLHMSAFIIARFLKNFSGLHGFCLNNSEPLKSLISCLTYPVNSVVSKILDIFLDVLLLNPLNKKPLNQPNAKMVLLPLKLENETSLISQFLSYMLVILLRCDIIDNLIYVLKKSSDEGNVTKSGFLLTEIFNLVVNIVPEELSMNISDFIPQEVLHGDEEDFNERTKAIFTLAKLTRKSNKGRSALGLGNLKTNENFIINSKITRNKINYDIDDVKLKQMINDTKVLSTKSFSKWNCELLSDLFKGPFMNGKKLDEINRTTKFLKRLLSFYRPFKRKFSSTKRTKHSVRFIKLGCVIIQTLLSSPEGSRILKENKIIPQIAECLAQVDPYSGFYAKDQIFSKERLETTLTAGYFKMLGVLSADEYGIKLLESWKIFSIVYHISDDQFKREDLLILFMDEIKLKKHGHSRVLLSKFLHSSNRKIKLHATRLLGQLLDDFECNEFICELLVEQLYEQDEEICGAVAKIMYEYFTKSDENLVQIVKFAPSIPILKNFTKENESVSILMKFLSTSVGFQYLNRLGIIEEEFQNWTIRERYLTYTEDTEKLLSLIDRDYEIDSLKISKELPMNLLRELVKTEEGFNVVVHSGFMTHFVNIIREYSINLGRSNDVSNFDFLRLKASLWSIGFIGTSDLGIEALDVNGSIEDIVKIAENSPLIDLRGCAFYVLGLISRTYQGIEILDELGWSSKLDVYKKPIGVVLPRDPLILLGWTKKDKVRINGDVLKIEKDLDEDEEESNVDFETDDDEYTRIVNDAGIRKDSVLTRIIKHVGNLCNHVFLNSSSKELTSLSKSHPGYFEDPDVFFRVLKFLESFKYRYTIRKFIIDLFIGNGSMLEIMVKRDKRRIKEMLSY